MSSRALVSGVDVPIPTLWDLRPATQHKKRRATRRKGFDFMAQVFTL
jgi:hypothetical protein